MDLLSAVALSTLPGIARPRAAAAFKALRASLQDEVTLETVIEACASTVDAGRVAAGARRGGAILVDPDRAARIDVVLWDADGSPPLLREIVDPPPVLWVRGAADVLPRPAVAIVGSRAASPHAQGVAGRLEGE